ncbi:MAG: S8 family serine peptidase [Vicingaceae bacterium]|nr:S8 family serine peptidase [Vicingaceae bacterium]
MIRILKQTSTFIIVFMLLVQAAFSQKTDNTLPKTIVFKIKEENRLSCSSTEISIPELNVVFSSVGVSKLEKIFPNKLKEERSGKVDLSLIYELKYANDFEVEEVIRMLKKLDVAKYVEPYYIPELTYTPNDTLFSSQYYISLIEANNAWDVNDGDTNIVVGITDTGWEPTHPDLLPNVKINYNDPVNGVDDDGDGFIDNHMGWDLGSDDNDATFESAFHGVSVTGLATATPDNTAGIAGVGFNTRFLPVKISNNVGVLTQAYQGIVYAADHGCFIINCSWGSFSYSQFGQDIVDYATINKGCLVVGAVGNDNIESTFYPAGYKGVLSVANSNETDLKSASSNYGYYVDVSAPGENLWTTYPNGSFGQNGGTSMAAPIVSGGAALLKAQFPAYNNYQIAALLQTTADDLNPNNPNYIDKIGSGRINLFTGVNATSPIFAALVNDSVIDNNDNNFFFGDTLSIEVFFENYLDPIAASTVVLSTTSPFVNIIDGVTNLPAMNTMASASNNTDPFKVEVLNGASLNEEVVFKAVITSGGFTNNEYFTVTLNPDYINLAENLVATTITSNGRIGFTDQSNTKGLGFEYDGNQLLYEAGLMIGKSSSRVSDGVRGEVLQDDDFAFDQNVRKNPPFVSALDLYGNFGDYHLSNNVDVFVKQFSYAYPGDKYVIVVYNISIVGFKPITNIHAGIFADWDIDLAALNKSGYDTARKLGYVKSLGNDTLYAGIKLLSPDAANNYSIDLDGAGGVNPNNGGFTTDEKFTTLSTSRNFAGGTSGADVAHVLSANSFNLNYGEQKTIAFAILAGDSLLDLQNSADAAQIRYDNDALTIEEVEVVNSINIYPNPSTGVFSIKSEEEIEKVVITNVVGEVVLTTNLKQLDITSQPNGIYFVEVFTENTRYSEKVVLLR